MRTIQLSHAEIELILNALEHVHITKMELIKTHRGILDTESIEKITKDAKRYEMLRSDIDNGRKDV